MPSSHLSRQSTCESGAQCLVIGRIGVLDMKTVAVGIESRRSREIKAGLNEGDVVVVGSRAQIKPGTIVVPKLASAARAGAR